MRHWILFLTCIFSFCVSCFAEAYARPAAPVPPTLRSPFAAHQARGSGGSQPRVGLDAIVDVIKLWRVAGYVRSLSNPENTAAIVQKRYVRAGDAFPVQIAGAAARVRVLVITETFVDLEVSASGVGRAVRISMQP